VNEHRAGAAEAPAGDESDLVTRLRASDPRSYEELVRALGGRMLAAARRIVRDEYHAQDCVQEAFLRAFRSVERFEARAALGTWLHRIVVNVALTRVRTAKRRNECSIEDLLPEFDADGCRLEGRHEIAADKVVESAETRVQVRACIDRLPDSLRNVLLARDIEGFDTAETAAMMGISAGAVKVRLHRARAALKSLLEREMGEDAT